MTDLRSPERNAGVTLTGRESSPVLLGGTQAFGLNETALAIWDLCDGQTTVEEMVEAVVELTGLDESAARSDVGGVIDEFEQLGIVTHSPWISNGE